MKSKISKIIAGTTLAAGIGIAGVAAGMEFKEEKNLQTQYVLETANEQTNPVKLDDGSNNELMGYEYTLNEREHDDDELHQLASYMEVKGKVTSYSKDSMTVTNPFGESNTFKITKNTFIEEDYLVPLKKGVLVEVKASDNTALEIETDNTMDVSGTIISDDKKSMTIKSFNGNKTIFTKESGYRLDRDGYRGGLKGLPVEISLNSDFNIVKAEIDIDFD